MLPVPRNTPGIKPHHPYHVKKKANYSQKNNKKPELCQCALQPPGIEGAQIELWNKKIGQEMRDNRRKAKGKEQERAK